MGNKVRLTIQLRFKRPDMKTRVPFSLQQVMVERCRFTAKDFRHRVGEIMAATGADMNLDNPGLASLPGNDQIAWMRGHGSIFTRRNEYQVDGFFDHRAVGNNN